MESVTISLDEQTLAATRARAAAAGRSLDEFIDGLLREDVSASARRPWVQEAFALADRLGCRSQGPRWTREELHER